MGKLLWYAAAVFALLGAPLLAGWVMGRFEIFWTVSGAALVQCYGASAVLAAAALMERRYLP